MDGYSRLGGTTPIAPVPGGGWAVQKKKRTSESQARDRRRGRENQGEKREEEPGGVSPVTTDNDREEGPTPEAEGDPGYGSFKKQTKKSRKVDLII